MPAWFAAVVFVAAVVFTYVFCVRPMRRGHGRCAMAPPTDDLRQEEIRRLREEIAQAKRETSGSP